MGAIRVDNERRMRSKFTGSNGMTLGEPGARPLPARPAFLVGLTLAACVAAGPAAADQVVYFVNGKAMLVRSIERGDRFTILEVEGGGRIGVPTDQIARIEEYKITAPAPSLQPVAVQPAVTPPPGAAAAAVQAGVPQGGTPAAPPVLGPTLGGRSTVAGGQGLGGLTPLSVGDPGGGRQFAPPRPGQGPAGMGNTGGPQRPGPAFGRPLRGGALGRPGMRPQPTVTAPPPGAPPATQFRYADPAAPAEDQPSHPADEPNPAPEGRTQEPDGSEPTEPEDAAADPPAGG
jgi:hypothetical protein